MDFFKLEPVVVYTTTHEVDEVGDLIEETQTQQEVDALVCPVSNTDLSEKRPYGDEVVYNIHFKKDFDADLYRAYIEVRGVRYKVQGNPQRLTDENTPTAFNLTAKVVRVDG